MLIRKKILRAVCLLSPVSCLLLSGCPKGIQTASDFVKAAECILVDESEKHMTAEEIAVDCGSSVEDVIHLLAVHKRAASYEKSCPFPTSDAGVDAETN